MSEARTRMTLIAACLLCLVATRVVVADGVAVGGSFCGHPPYAPYHFASCPLYQDYSSGSSGGSGSRPGPSLAGLSAERAARRERLAELERQRREELRQERIARAAEFRREVEERHEQMRARLQGVFDLAPLSRGADFDGREEPAGPEAPVDGSAVDLRPVSGSRRDLEARLRGAAGGPDGARLLTGAHVDPAFLAGQAQRAADTSAFADENYWSVPMEPSMGPDEAKSLKWRAWELTKWMTESAVSEAISELVPGGEAALRAKRIYDATTGLVEDVEKLLSPHTSWAIVYSPAEAEHIMGEAEKIPIRFLRDVTDDKSLEHEEIRDILLGKE